MSARREGRYRSDRIWARDPKMRSSSVHGSSSMALALVLVGAAACGDDGASTGGGGSGGIVWAGGNGGTGGGGAEGGGGTSPDGGGGSGAGASGGGDTGGAGAGGDSSGSGGEGASGGGACDGPVQCDDADACTEDACDGGTCDNVAIDPSDGIDCTMDACDPVTGVSNVVDDAACDDMVACTDDACVEGDGCAHVPNAANCMGNEGCDPVAGCQASTITSVSPNDGLALGTTVVTLQGTGLTTGTISFDGVVASCSFAGGPTTVTCNVPPGAVGRGDVVYGNASGATATLPDGWTFTGVANETDAMAEADYCNLQFPSTLTVSAGQASELVYGRIFEAGRTDVAMGAAPGILAELGFGPSSSNPTTSTAWRFAPASFNLEVGNDDEYEATLTVPAAGSYAYTYRFSLDDGLNFTYCDTNGAGSNGGLGFESNSLGSATVN